MGNSKITRRTKEETNNRREFNKLYIKSLNLKRNSKKFKLLIENAKDSNKILKEPQNKHFVEMGDKLEQATDLVQDRDFVFKNIGHLKPSTIKEILKDCNWKRKHQKYDITPQMEVKIAQAYSRGLEEVEIKKFYPEVPLKVIQDVIKRCIIYPDEQDTE